MSITARDSIVNTMLNQLEDTRCAPFRSHAVLLTGAKGVGKSLIVSKFAQQAQKRNIQLVEVHCRINDDRPHGAILDCLHGLAAQTGRAIEKLPFVHRAVTRLSGLSPQFKASELRRPNLKGLLAESIRQAMLELSQYGHMCIIVHDVDRTEPSTTDISLYLLEDLLADAVFEWNELEIPSPTKRPSNGAFILFSFRSEGEMSRLVNLASTTEAIDVIQLKPLNIDGVKQFLCEDEVAQIFLERSGGMPLRLTQLIKALPEHPNISVVSQSKHFSPELIARLDILAVAQVPMTPRQLDELVNDGSDSLSLLSQASDIVSPKLEQGRPCFSFGSETERETWRDRMDRRKTKEIHRKLAERMAAGLFGHPETIARHFLGAGCPEQAIPFVMETIPSLLRAHAFNRASFLLESIVDVASGSLQAEILMTLLECYSSINEFDRAFTLLEKLKEHEAQDSEAVYMKELALLIQAGNISEVKIKAKELAELTQDIHRHKARALLADFFLREGDLDRSEQLCCDAEPSQKNNFDPRLELELLNTQGKIYLFREAFDEAELIFRRNFSAAKSLDEIEHEAKALINLGVVYLQQGFISKALKEFETVRELCTKHGDIAHLAVALENLAVLHYRQQNFKQALYFYHRSASSSRRLGRNAQFSTTILNLGDLYLTVGDVQKAQRLTSIARSYVDGGKHRFLEPQLWTLEGDLARHLGKYDEACDKYAQAEALIRTGSFSNQRLIPLLRAESELHLDHGQLERAQQKLNEALSLVSGMHEELALRLRITHGAILSEQGLLDDALSELNAAVHGATEGNDVEALWLALARLGLVQWRLGQTSEAKLSFVRAQKETLRLLTNLPTNFRTLYTASPNQKRLNQHLDRLSRGLEPTNCLESSVDQASAKRPDEPFKKKWIDVYPKIIGRSSALASIFKLLDRVSGTEGMVLICGESGTGKELVAEALHRQSPRRDGPFIKVNCAAFVETLLLSELFGHEKGAFTGATSGKKGRFELADGGTLFLDEIGDISPNTQVALLRVLQEGTLDRVGGSETISVNVRVICATHRNLEQMVDDGSFRMDLYYRLRGLTIDLPALRDRKSDIPLLVEHFLEQNSEKAAARRITPDAMASLIQHNWPGNVRELENVVRSASLFSQSEQIELRDLIELGHIFGQPSLEATQQATRWMDAIAPSDFNSEGNKAETRLTQEKPEPINLPNVDLLGTGEGLLSLVSESGGLLELKKRLEYEAIAYTLKQTKGNISKAAERLGMKRPRLSQIISSSEALNALKEESLK